MASTGQTRNATLPVDILDPPPSLYQVCIRSGSLDDADALFKWVEEEAGVEAKANKAYATMTALTRMVVEELESRRVDVQRTAKFQELLEKSTLRILRRLQENGITNLADARDQLSSLPGCLCHIGFEKGGVTILENNLTPFLLTLNNVQFVDIVPKVIRRLIAWLACHRLREPVHFVASKQAIKACLFRLVNHLAGLDGTPPAVPQPGSSTSQENVDVPARPIAHIAPGLLTACRMAKDVDNDLGSCLILEIVRECRLSSTPAKSFTNGLLPLFSTLQQQGLSLSVEPINRASLEILQLLPAIIGEVPQAIVKALEAMKETHAGCGSTECNESIMRHIPPSATAADRSACRNFLSLRRRMFVFMSLFDKAAGCQLAGPTLLKSIYKSVLCIPPTPHLNASQCAHREVGDIARSKNQVEAGPGESSASGSQPGTKQKQTTSSLRPSVDDAATNTARGANQPTPALSLPRAHDKDIDGLLLNKPDPGLNELTPKAPTRAGRALHPLPSRAITRRSWHPLPSIGPSSAPIPSSSSSDDVRTELDVEPKLDEPDLSIAKEIDREVLGYVIEGSNVPRSGTPTSTTSNASKRSFKLSPGSSIPAFFKRVRQTSPEASTSNDGVMSAPSVSSDSLGGLVLNPMEGQSSSLDHTPGPIPNLSDDMQLDFVLDPSTHSPESRAMEITPPRLVNDGNPMSYGSLYNDTPTRQTNTRRAPLEAITPRTLMAQLPFHNNVTPTQAEQGKSSSIPEVPPAPRPNKFKDFTSSLGARLPSRRVSGGSRKASGGGARAVSDQASRTRPGENQRAETTLMAQSVSSGLRSPRSRPVSLGTSLGSLLGKIGPGKRAQK
ncbi:hypothetical protein SISSUDRAFT_1054508 [Sistotremastrum suecicum HHB10207 ss-3]|uniref:Uncharacterized protein n=1 Tax=Sistotremastrum suecicum HHB10207 ss-3 TaxID=1314776 RepID=A0A165YGD3_9AGAM|nr:hypothetical protein SISSUDRAFT_1054508 [Sistotremastrum suecicum HHB10207 ss-3]